MIVQNITPRGAIAQTVSVARISRQWPIVSGTRRVPTSIIELLARGAQPDMQSQPGFPGSGRLMTDAAERLHEQLLVLRCQAGKEQKRHLAASCPI
jgi:hypothetical protein